MLTAMVLPTTHSDGHWASQGCLRLPPARRTSWHTTAMPTSRKRTSVLVMVVLTSLPSRKHRSTAPNTIQCGLNPPRKPASILPWFPNMISPPPPSHPPSQPAEPNIIEREAWLTSCILPRLLLGWCPLRLPSFVPPRCLGLADAVTCALTGRHIRTGCVVVHDSFSRAGKCEAASMLGPGAGSTFCVCRL